MHTYLIVGASRGIGLALVEELLKDSSTYVLAAARSPTSSPGLQALTATYPPTRLSTLELDIADSASVERAASYAKELLPEGGCIVCLIHNAAISLQRLTPFKDVDLLAFQQELLTNTIAPLHVLRSFLPLLTRSPYPSEKKVVFVSSALGSVEAAPGYVGCSETYSVSKAGLGMLARKWGTSLKDEGICTMVLHPGWVDTDLGHGVSPWVAEHAPELEMMSPAESAAQCLRVIRDARIEDAVSFYAYDGSRIPW